MTKGKAIAWAIVFSVLSVSFFIGQVYGCATPFFIIAAVFGVIAYSKHKRDLKIINTAELDRTRAIKRLIVPPPMTSKGSNRLFVPEQLQEQRHH